MENNIPQIKSNLLAEENKSAAAEMNRLLMKYGKNGAFDFYPQKNRASIFNGDILATIEACAFKYALEKDKKMAALAYESFFKCCKSMNLANIYDDYRPLGQMMLTAAEIYDWCFPALSKKQKDFLISQCLKFASKLQIGYPPTKQGAVTGHGCENQLLRAYLACGIAFYDEKPDFWNIAAGRFYEEFVPARKFVYDSKEPIFQGTDYGPYRSIFDLWSSLLITGMGEPEPYEGKINNWAEFYIYSRRPDGLYWRKGDAHSIERNYDDTFRIATNAFLSFAVTKNPHTKFLALELTKNFSSFKYNANGESDELLTPVQFLIFNKPEIRAEDYSKLKTVYYAPYPMGEYYAFSNWNDSNAVSVHAKIGEQFTSNHEHRDAGSFEIFCRKILANVSGYYQSGGGSEGYKSDMTQKYFHAAVAQNTLLIEPKSPKPENYGDQKNLPEVKTLSEWLSKPDYRRGKVLCFEENLKDGKGTVSISGEITNAYENAESVIRTMTSVFTGNEKCPLIFVVYDKVICKKDYNGVFLLHSNVEPEILPNKKSQTIKNEGFLKNTTLLPSNPDVTKIGGKEKRWSVAGLNLGDENNKRLKEGNETGWGRIEIRGKKSEEVFLNVMQVSPEEQDFPEPTMTETEDSYLIQVGAEKIRISKDGKNLEDDKRR